MVSVTDVTTNHSRPLEARRELFENQGDFYWGDDDIGCQFLAVSILAHHFDGVLPADAPVEALRDYLECLMYDSDYEIETELLLCLINNATNNGPNSLERLEISYPSPADRGDADFFEVKSLFGQMLTIRCANGIESVVDTSAFGERIARSMEKIKIFLPDVERNAEPIRKAIAIRLLVQRDPVTRKVVRILDSFDVHMIN